MTSAAIALAGPLDADGEIDVHEFSLRGIDVGAVRPLPADLTGEEREELAALIVRGRALAEEFAA